MLPPEPTLPAVPGGFDDRLLTSGIGKHELGD
jgi:hypothetical protein